MQIIITENDFVKMVNYYKNLKQHLKNIEKTICIERFSGQIDDQKFSDECIDTIKYDINQIGEIIERVKFFNSFNDLGEML